MDRFDGGTVRLPDGEWHCSVVRLVEMPEHAVVSQILFFEHVTDTRSRMRVVVPEELLGMEPEEMVRYAMRAAECWWRGRVGCGVRDVAEGLDQKSPGKRRRGRRRQRDSPATASCAINGRRSQDKRPVSVPSKAPLPNP